MSAPVAVIGAGRVGLTLARALTISGTSVTVFNRRPRTLPAPLAPAAEISAGSIAPARLVVIAVPDDAIAETAEALKATGAIGAGHTVLHTSGLHDRTALAVLESTGAALGSFHPVQTLRDRDGEPEMLRGAPVVIEGDERALAMARDIAQLIGLTPVVTVASGRKVMYHAAAVFASNYLVALASLVEQLGAAAGAGAEGLALFEPLMRQSLANALAVGPGQALTGPIRRGDVGTVAAHLDALHGIERQAYQSLGKVALQLARQAGVEAQAAAKIERLLES